MTANTAGKILHHWVFKKNIHRFLVIVHMQELTNPTVEAPGKGYIGEYTMKVSSVDLKQSTPERFVL